MNRYLHGADIIVGTYKDEVIDAEVGASLAQGPMSSRALLIKVKDVAGLVRAQGGATGAVAFALTPDTIENTVYEKMKDELSKGLKEKNVSADVTVVQPAGFQPAVSAYLRGAVLGAGVIGIGWGLFKLFGKRRT